MGTMTTFCHDKIFLITCSILVRLKNTIDIVYSLQSLCRMQAQQIQLYFAIISRKHTHRLEESTEYSVG